MWNWDIGLLERMVAVARAQFANKAIPKLRPSTPLRAGLRLPPIESRIAYNENLESSVLSLLSCVVEGEVADCGAES